MKAKLEEKRTGVSSYFRARSNKAEYIPKYELIFSYTPAAQENPIPILIEVDKEEYNESSEGDSINIVLIADTMIGVTQKSHRKYVRNMLALCTAFLVPVFISFLRFPFSSKKNITEPTTRRTDQQPLITRQPVTNEYTKHSPDGSWRIEIDWASGGAMGHYIACPVVYNREGKLIFSLANTSFELGSHTYDAQRKSLTLFLEKYPDRARYFVQLNLNEGNGIVQKVGSRIPLLSPMSELSDKLLSLG